ncbi:transposase [Fulvivirga sp. M361]|uniref:REP-associated tyrosine transposase n=1 Tax=Fulvivirga sp. M361 TaxID=2594266 RepID=UPI00117A65DC|nr:transposase [Fulvivirga sp. M361]TRX44928.1 transposase [Fulvivirga sp. M361]
MSVKYKIRDQTRLHFITFAVVEWVDVFTRNVYKDVLIDSLRYCQKHKGLLLYGWCIMTNHVHLIISSADGFKQEYILRDFKKHTSRQLITMIEGNLQESRKNRMLWLFKEAGKRNSNNKYYQFWQQDNHPLELSGNLLMDQKLSYLHNNPVEAGIVDEPESYLYSSARDYSGRKGFIDIEFIE